MMRRIDVWVGRAVALVGLVYVLLASLWPLTASGATPGRATSASIAIAAMPPSTLVDVRLVKVIADVGAAGEERRRTRRSIASTTIAMTPESWAMLLVASLVFCAAVVTTTIGHATAAARRASPTARSACRPRPGAAA